MPTLLLPARVAAAVLVITSCAASRPATAQDDRGAIPQVPEQEAPLLRFKRIGLEDGLEQVSARAMIQDRAGFIWIGTEGGVHRYDGHSFKVFAPTPFDTLSISGAYINAIAEAANGDIWVAAWGNGLNRLDPSTGHAVRYQHDPEDPSTIPSDNLSSVLETSAGDVWVGTSNSGISRMRPDRVGIFEQYRHDPDDPQSLSSDGVLSISEDRSGNVWISTGNGVNRIEAETGRLTRYLADPELD